MNTDEILVILGTLKIAYPAFYKDLKKSEADNLVNLWSVMFESDNVKIVTEAVKALICTSKFPPSIADVKEKIALITQPSAMTEIEAWNMVRNAISYYNASENFNRLPEIIQKLVGSPGQLREWAQMDSTTVDSVIQSNFMRSYKARVIQEKEYNLLPESTKKVIGIITGSQQKLLE